MRKTMVLALVLAVLIVGIGAAQTKLTFAHETVDPHPVYLQGEKFKELVSSLSGGKMELNVFSGGALGAAMETAQQVKMGSLDIAILSTPIVQFVPEYGAFDLPYLFKDREHAFKVVRGEIGEELSRKLEKTAGMIVLDAYENGFRQITNSVRPINQPSDLRGVKLRTPSSQIRVQAFKTFGAAPAPLAWTEVYGALQKRVMDGQENPVGNIYSGKLWEVQKYLSITNHVYGFQFILMNKRSYERLKPEEQRILKTAARQASDWVNQWIADNEDQIIRDLVKEGMILNRADTNAFRKVALEQIWPQYDKEYGELIRKISQAAE